MDQDRQTDKTTRWSFTAYEEQWYLFVNIKAYPDVAEWGWQLEKCPKTDRMHYQGYIRTKRQFRHAGMRKMFPQVHIEGAREWFKLVNYCRKKDTAIEGTQIHARNDTEFWSLERLMIELTHHVPAAIESVQEVQDRHHVTFKPGEIDSQIFWYCARQVLMDEPNRASSLNQPSIERFFTKTRSVWMDERTRALVLQPVAQEAEADADPKVVELNSPELV